MNLSPDMLPYVIAVAAALIVLVIGIGLAGNGEMQSKGAVEKRLKRNLGPLDPIAERMRKRDSEKNSRHVRRETTYSSINAFDNILRRIFPNPDKLRGRLERTGKAISIGEFFLVIAVTVMATGVFVRLYWNLEPQIAVLIGMVVGLTLPAQVIKVMGNRRVGKFMKEFPAAIDMIVRGLRSGLPFVESVSAVGKEFPDPIGIEFRRISDGVKLGQSVENAMWDISQRITVPEFKFLIVAMTIQRETGGNLAETLNNLSDLLRKREGLKLKIRALSSEARASAYIIGSLPFVMYGLIRVVSPDYATLLWTDPRGQNMAMYGIGWMCIGYFVMWRMVNFEI